MRDNRETKYPRKLSPRELRLRTSIALSVLALAGAGLWTYFLWVEAGYLCTEAGRARDAACVWEYLTKYLFPGEGLRGLCWLVLPWGIAGLLVILVVMWARRAQRGGG